MVRRFSPAGSAMRASTSSRDAVVRHGSIAARQLSRSPVSIGASSEPEVAMGALQRVGDHVEVFGRGQGEEERDEGLERGIGPVRVERAEAHHRFFGVIEQPTGEAVEQIQILAHRLGQTGSRLRQPRVEVAFGNRPVEQRQHADEVERQGHHRRLLGRLPGPCLDHRRSVCSPKPATRRPVAERR
jgi:hypothetical protein